MAPSQAQVRTASAVSGSLIRCSTPKMDGIIISSAHRCCRARVVRYCVATELLAVVVFPPSWWTFAHERIVFIGEHILCYQFLTREKRVVMVDGVTPGASVDRFYQVNPTFWVV